MKQVSVTLTALLVLLAGIGGIVVGQFWDLHINDESEAVEYYVVAGDTGTVNFQQFATFEISHNADHPSVVTIFIDDEQITFKNGNNCLITDSDQKFGFIFNNYTPYKSQEQIRAHMSVYFDGVKGKLIA